MGNSSWRCAVLLAVLVSGLTAACGSSGDGDGADAAPDALCDYFGPGSALARTGTGDDPEARAAFWAELERLVPDHLQESIELQRTTEEASRALRQSGDTEAASALTATPDHREAVNALTTYLIEECGPYTIEGNEAGAP